ncbi:MAG: hypothetical protein N2482_01660 [Patescibacteria group bacterium]|nr:hypothetical protein [Patescibacteria group bacterium]
MASFYLLGFKKIFGFLKKAFLILAVYFFVISLFLHFINKDRPKHTGNLIEKNRQEIYQTINNPQLKKTKQGKIFIALYRLMYCSFIGEACTDNPSDGDKNFHHSVFGFVTKLIVLPYTNLPASGMYWAYSGLQNAGFIPKTYAAEGIGFAAIKPFMNIWKVFRDISYMLLVLVLIAIGFMIMFRTKLNPQTVISVENSLPKIVVSLILITFSFPIAGFLIDLMYVIIIVIISILAPQLSQSSAEIASQYLNPSFGKIFPRHFFKNMAGVGMALFNIMPEGIRSILIIALQIASGIFFTKIFKELLGGDKKGLIKQLTELFDGVHVLGNSLGSLLNIIGIVADVLIFISIALFGFPFFLALLVFFTVLFLIFRVFFALFMNYLQIILLIIFAPFLLVFEAIPGKGTFSFWLKNLIANLLGFIVVITLILVSDIIMRTFSVDQPTWAPPFIYGLDGKSIAALIGMGIYLLIPDFLKLIKELLGAKGLPINLGLGTFFGGVGAAFSGGMGAISQITSLSQTPGIGKIVKPIAKKLGLSTPTPLSEEYFQQLIEKGGIPIKQK